MRCDRLKWVDEGESTVIMNLVFIGLGVLTVLAGIVAWGKYGPPDDPQDDTEEPDD